jgi:hypothetical protein
MGLGDGTIRLSNKRSVFAAAKAMPLSEARARLPVFVQPEDEAATAYLHAPRANIRDLVAALEDSADAMLNALRANTRHSTQAR